MMAALKCDWSRSEPPDWKARMLAALGDGGQRKLCRMWVEVLAAAHELVRQSSQEVRPPTGEPDAGDPPVRFGGRGGRNQSSLPTPIPLAGKPARSARPASAGRGR